MGFYGMAVLATALIAAAMVSGQASLPQRMDSVAWLSATYHGLQESESFWAMARAAMQAGQPVANLTYAIESSAMADGLQVTAYNGTLVISTSGAARMHSIIRLNTG